MQRQLDYDLDEQELTILMTHLKECEQCNILFERLTLLSGSLEQLPRVTPSVNIVDSILPDLEAIDRQRSNHLIAKRKKMKMWITSASSIAAAAVVVFIMSTIGNNSLFSNHSSQDVAFSGDTRIVEPTEIGQMSSTANANNLDLSKLMDRAESDSQLESQELMIEPLSSPIMRSGLDGYYSITEQFGASQNEVGSSASSSSTNEREVTKQTPEKLNPSTGDGGEALPSTAESGADRGVSSSGAAVKEEETIESPGNGMLGITTINPNITKNFSPDESVYIVFQENTIALYETSTENLLQTWETEAYGEAKLVAWDLEGTSFIYEVTDETGVHNSYTIQINKQ